jgi:hypothetical protein
MTGPDTRQQAAQISHYKATPTGQRKLHEAHKTADLVHLIVDQW